MNKFGDKFEKESVILHFSCGEILFFYAVKFTVLEINPRLLQRTRLFVTAPPSPVLTTTVFELNNLFTKIQPSKVCTLILKMEFVLEEGKHVSDDCSNLILPALSIGNVGQLAVDLLVSSIGAETVGYLDDPFVLPCVGNDAYRPIPRGDLALPLQAYESSSSGLTLIQQRSPVIKGMMVEYAKNLADFAAANGKKHVVVLSGLDFGRLQRIDMSSGLQIYYLSSTNADGTDDYCEQLGWKRLQEYNPAQRCWKYLSSLAEGNAGGEENLPFEDDLEEEDYYPSLPFAALFSCLKTEVYFNLQEVLRLLNQARGLKATCLLCYCSEGDNIADAFNLAEAACKLLRLNPDNFHGEGGERWAIPFSWKTVYGPPPDMSMF